MMENIPTPRSLRTFLRQLRQALKLNRFFDSEIKVILNYYAFAIRQRIKQGEKVETVLRDYAIDAIVKSHDFNSLNFLTPKSEHAVPSFLNHDGLLPDFRDINEAYPDEKKIGNKRHIFFRIHKG